MTALGGLLAVLAVAGGMVVMWGVMRSRSGVGQEAAESVAQLRRLIDDLPEALLMIDRDRHVLVANEACGSLTGWDAARVSGADLLDLLAEIDSAHSAADLSNWWDKVISNGDGAPLLLNRRTIDDEQLTLECTARVIASSACVNGGDSDRIVLRVWDVSTRERDSSALEQARRRFQQAFHSAPTGMALVRVDDGRVVDANQSLAEMLALEPHEIVGRTLGEFTHADDLHAAIPHHARLELGIVDSYRLDLRYLRADGRPIWARTRVAATEDDGVMLAITHIEDITEHRQTAERLTHAASHDELTGLPNRSYLMDLLDDRLSKAQPNTVAVLFVDLDNFKVVNDSLGHSAGDELLRKLAERLRQVMRETDVLARFGGDEFVAVLDGAGRTVDAREAAQRLRRACLAPLMIGDHELFVSASIGYALNTELQMSSHDLLRFADTAMYRAKASGRDAVEAFDASDPEASANALRTANQLRKGLERHELVPYFQPIVDLSTGRVLGHEVLARWLHPDRGLLAPSEFLALAEETGQMVELGAGMLRDSLAQLAAWREAGLQRASGTLSVNVATRQLMDPDFYQLIADVLAETGIDADSLWLEITESSLLADVKNVSATLRDLRSLGLHLSVDDFGTGYSSLTYLKRFPVEAIKIDRSFVRGLGLESDDTAIVDAVIKLGQALGLSVVAEGIETPLQLSMLRQLGCDRGQGYLFGRPRPAALIVHDHADVMG